MTDGKKEGELYALFPFLVDRDEGMATYGTRFIDEYIERFKPICIHLDPDHGLYFMCHHPVTKEFDYHSLLELISPERTDVVTKTVLPFARKDN